jgi:hypothetical protein
VLQTRRIRDTNAIQNGVPVCLSQATDNVTRYKCSPRSFKGLFSNEGLERQQAECICTGRFPRAAIMAPKAKKQQEPEETLTRIAIVNEDR